MPGAPPIEKRNLTQEAQLATAHALLQAAQNAADQPGAAQPAQSYNPRAPQRSYPRAPIPSKGRTPQSPPPSRVPKLTLPQTPPPAPEPPATTMDGAKRQSENQLHNWRAYFNELAFQESSGDPKAKNTTAGGIGAHGLAQLRLPAFIDIGYVIVNDEHDGTKKKIEWTGRDGADSLEAYQSNPDIQRKSAARLAHKQNRYIENAGLNKYVGATVNVDGKPVVLSKAAIFAATHYSGAQGLKDYFDAIQRGGQSSDAPANSRHQEIEKRFREFEKIPFALPFLYD